MAEIKTKPTAERVDDFLNAIADPQKREDAFAMLEMMRQATGQEPKLWGSNIVGFGDLHYKYASGREGDWFVMGFSPRKQNFSLYFSWDPAQHRDLIDRLGKHSMGASCMYVKRLADIQPAVLAEIMQRVAAHPTGTTG